MKRKHTRSCLKGIAAIRHDMGYSQTRLAQALGVPRSTLSMVELGKRELPTSALVKLAELELERLATEQFALDMAATVAEEEEEEPFSIKIVAAPDNVTIIFSPIKKQVL